MCQPGHGQIARHDREPGRTRPGVCSRRQGPVPRKLAGSLGLQMLGHLAVQRRSTAWAHTLIKRLPHQVVHERTGHHHTGCCRFLQQRLDLSLSQPGDTGQAADIRRAHDAGDPEKVDGLLAQPGEPMLQELPHTRRDRTGRRATAGLQPGHLDGEEGVARTSPVNLGKILLTRFTADDPPDQSRGRLAVEAG